MHNVQYKYNELNLWKILRDTAKNYNADREFLMYLAFKVERFTGQQFFESRLEAVFQFCVFHTHVKL